MIDLHDAGNLNFKCEYCNQPFSHYTVNIAVLLYGVAFLKKSIFTYQAGDSSGYACLTCPSCMKTMLMMCEDLSEFYGSISKVVGLDDLNEKNDLAYSFLLFHYQDSWLNILDRFGNKNNTFDNRNEVEAPPTFIDYLSAFETDSGLSQTDFLISYGTQLSDLSIAI